MIQSRGALAPDADVLVSLFLGGSATTAALGFASRELSLQWPDSSDAGIAVFVAVHIGIGLALLGLSANQARRQPYALGVLTLPLVAALAALGGLVASAEALRAACADLGLPRALRAWASGAPTLAAAVLCSACSAAYLVTFSAFSHSAGRMASRISLGVGLAAGAVLGLAARTPTRFWYVPVILGLLASIASAVGRLRHFVADRDSQRAAPLSGRWIGAAIALAAAMSAAVIVARASGRANAADWSSVAFGAAAALVFLPTRVFNWSGAPGRHEDGRGLLLALLAGASVCLAPFEWGLFITSTLAFMGLGALLWQRRATGDSLTRAIASLGRATIPIAVFLAATAAALLPPSQHADEWEPHAPKTLSIVRRTLVGESPAAVLASPRLRTLELAPTYSSADGAPLDLFIFAASDDARRRAPASALCATSIEDEATRVLRRATRRLIAGGRIAFELPADAALHDALRRMLSRRHTAFGQVHVLRVVTPAAPYVAVVVGNDIPDWLAARAWPSDYHFTLSAPDASDVDLLGVR